MTWRTRLCYKFNRNHTARAERYWEVINRPKVPQEILDELYVYGGNQVLSVEGKFKPVTIMQGDIFTYTKHGTGHLFTFDDLLELVSA